MGSLVESRIGEADKKDRITTGERRCATRRLWDALRAAIVDWTPHVFCCWSSWVVWCRPTRPRTSSLPWSMRREEEGREKILNIEYSN